MHPDATQPLLLLFTFPGLRAGGVPTESQSLTTVHGYHDWELVFTSFCLFVYSTFSPEFLLTPSILVKDYTFIFVISLLWVCLPHMPASYLLFVYIFTSCKHPSASDHRLPVCLLFMPYSFQNFTYTIYFIFSKIILKWSIYYTL